MGHSNYLLEHLLDRRFQSPPAQVVYPRVPLRLVPEYAGVQGGWQYIARLVATSADPATVKGRPPVNWFPDANVGILTATEPVWDALRLVALASGRSPAILTAVVYDELKEWIELPYHDKRRANAIRESLQLGNAGWVRLFRLASDSPIWHAILGYARLLGMRRKLARPSKDGLTRVGTDAADKSGTMNAIANKIGRRALGLAKKGRIDAEKSGKININDELHCLMAIASALVTGEEAVILTTDPDYKEIFWKAQWFIDTHYRAWLAGKLVKNGEFGAPAGQIDDAQGYFTGPLLLYRRTTTHLLEVLPPTYTPVSVHVFYVEESGLIHRLSFRFEREMSGMLETRAATCGRCTDQFGDANIHVDLASLKSRFDQLYLGIGRDQGPVYDEHGVRSVLSQIDIEHSLHCFEQYSWS